MRATQTAAAVALPERSGEIRSAATQSGHKDATILIRRQVPGAASCSTITPEAIERLAKPVAGIVVIRKSPPFAAAQHLLGSRDGAAADFAQDIECGPFSIAPAHGAISELQSLVSLADFQVEHYDAAAPPP